MSQETAPRVRGEDLDHEHYLNRSLDLVERVRSAKETAGRELRTFGDVAEYEIRKIFGQKSTLPDGSTTEGASSREGASPRNDTNQRVKAANLSEQREKPETHSSQSSFSFTDNKEITDQQQEREP